ILAQWELNEGSSVMVDELLEKERTLYKISNESRLNTLKELLEKKFYLATDYNDEKSVTRFMQVNLLTSEQLSEDFFLQDKKLNADGNIYYIIPSDQSSYVEAIESIYKSNDKLTIFAITDSEVKPIKTALDRLIGLKSIYSNKNLLAEHVRLDEEISILIAEIQFEIKEFLKEFEHFNENV